MHASSWDGNVSGAWLEVVHRGGCFATMEVEALLDMGPTPGEVDYRAR